jgi:hypothetical protein
MNEQLKKIKDLLEKSFKETDKRDMLIGQAIGHIDSLLENSPQESPLNKTLPIPDMVWKHTEKPNKNTMMDAVERHKDVHNKLVEDSISQRNTQFKKLQ